MGNDDTKKPRYQMSVAQGNVSFRGPTPTSGKRKKEKSTRRDDLPEKVRREFEKLQIQDMGNPERRQAFTPTYLRRTKTGGPQEKKEAELEVL